MAVAMGTVRVGARRAPGLPALAGIAVAFWLGSPAPALGQFSVAPDIGAVGGIVSYNIDTVGKGKAAFGGVRLRLPLSRHILVEPSVSYGQLRADTLGRGGDVDTPFVIAEFQLQAQLHLDRYRPYMGVGAGGMLDLRADRGRVPEGGSPADFLVSTYSTALGVATDLKGWSIRTEVRRRWVDDFDDSAAELTLAVARMF